MVESTGTSPPYDRRLDHAQRWLNKLYENVGFNWDPIAGDASNRRYFRVEVDGHSHVVMDAPPEHGSQAQFVDIARRLHAAGLHAPRIIRRNLTQGYLLLEDLGDALYRDLLNEDSVTDLFDQAFDALATMALEVDTDGLPDYGEALMYDEMYWFVDYYLNRHRNVTLDHAQRQSWTQLCDTVVASALAQPRVFVHRDVHSCNLLQTSENNLGIIDFQDAATGPLSYDFISLIWDRYIAWPRDRLEQWMAQFHQRVCPDVGLGQWVRWCDLMGLQRNITIVGRFAVLEHVERKSGYADMIPAFYQYVLDVLARYPEFEEAAEWIGSTECAP